MEAVIVFLQQEFRKRSERNPRYSLRAFARSLDVDHATLSSMLNGKRKITSRSAERFLKSLNVTPLETSVLLSQNGKGEAVSTPYFLIQQDAFDSISEWYFDAILELVDVVEGQLSSKAIANRLGLSSAQAKIARATLVRLGFLKRKPDGRYERCNQDTTTILDDDSTNAAMRKHQKALAEKSVIALDEVTKAERDHTSLCLAFNRVDLPKARALISKFRREFNKELGKNLSPDSVYQLQVALFPLTQPKGKSE